MRTFGRFLCNGKDAYGEVLGDEVHFLTQPFWLGLTFSGKIRSLGELTVDVPVAPGKVIAVGLNYSEHIKEMQRTEIGSPLIWFKAPSSLLPPRRHDRIAFPEHKTDFETELAVVIGAPAKERQRERTRSTMSSVTRSAKTSAIAICRNQKNNFGAANLSTPTRRSGRSFTPALKWATSKFRCAKTAK